MGVRLPLALEQELGLDLRKGRGRRNDFATNGRREQRNDRVEKRKPLRGGQSNGRARNHEEYEEDSAYQKPAPVQKKVVPVIRDARTTEASPPRPKSILKKPRQPSPSPTPSSDDEFGPRRSLSPEIVLDASSKSYRDRLADDEDEIEALEKRLGLKGKKSGKSNDENGLGDLLGDIEDDDEQERKKRKSEEKEWLQRKRRRRAEPEPDDEVEVEDEEDADADADETDDFATLEEADDAFSGFGSDEEAESDSQQPKKIRENPYLPPVAPSASTTKYIPPSLRKLQNGEDQSLQRLRRQIQGHLNKLSEANLVSILKEIETIYSSNPRQDVTSTLLDLLLSSFCERAALQTTFVLLHAAFCSAVYKVIGTDFGAELLARLVDRFSLYFVDNSDGGKEALNLVFATRTSLHLPPDFQQPRLLPYQPHPLSPVRNPTPSYSYVSSATVVLNFVSDDPSALKAVGRSDSKQLPRLCRHQCLSGRNSCLRPSPISKTTRCVAQQQTRMLRESTSPGSERLLEL